jgi:membrane protein involved in colicin uptake
MTEEKNNNGKSWKFNRQVNVSVLIQIVLLASLIVGSWVNLQGQLDMLQKDVTVLLDNQNKFERRIESLQAKSIAFEYRIRAIEKQINGENPQTETFNDLGERR